MPYFEIFTLLLTGACIGSFLNVCIYRIPLNKSVVHPGSHCAACGAPIPWFLNLPVLGWFILNGKTACCGTRLDLRYAMVEALTAILFAWIWLLYPPLTAAIHLLVVCALIVATFIDIDHFIIPDRITLGGCVAGLVVSTIYPPWQGRSSPLHGFLASFEGLLLGGGLLLFIAICGRLILRKEAMGMGDVKFLAALGAFLGWKAPLFIIAVSSLCGSIIGISLMLRRQKRWGLKMPYGPCLALAALIWQLGGHLWMAQYLKSLQLAH